MQNLIEDEQEEIAGSVAEPFKALEPIKNTTVAPAHGIAAIALSMAMKYHDINTVKDGALYQQYKLEGKNFAPLHLDMVFETAIRIEAHLLGASTHYRPLPPPPSEGKEVIGDNTGPLPSTGNDTPPQPQHDVAGADIQHHLMTLSMFIDDAEHFELADDSVVDITDASCAFKALQNHLAADSARTVAFNAMREALNKIRCTPAMPFPNPDAHSWRAFGEAVRKAWRETQGIARTALALADKVAP